MSVNVGTVRTFDDVEPSKEQALKPLEEAAEVFGAWQCIDGIYTGGSARPSILVLDEIADCIQALCNLAASFGVDDLAPYMEECERRNEERGRYGVLASDGKPIKA